MCITRMRELNQMDLKEDSILCHSCKGWLTTPIYICKDEKNYCEPCADKLAMVKIRNWALENLLENLIYRCDYCDEYSARQAKALQHKQLCKDRPIATCCNENLKPYEMEDHLVYDHSMKSIDITDNVAIIQLANKLEKPRFWETELNNNNFIIRIVSTGDSLEVNVATNGSDAQNETAFFVNCLNQGNTGKVIDYRTMFDKSAVVADKATAKLNLPTSEEIKLEITFGQEKVYNVKIIECPICMHPLTEKVFNCVNGHMICSNCKPKISSCALCRQKMGDAFFNIANLLPEYITPCHNANDGCLHRSPENVMSIHRIICKYNLKVECDSCHKMIAKCNLSAHIDKCYCKNKRYEFVNSNGNNHIFTWTKTIIGNNRHYNVRMLHANAKEAAKYGFKVLHYKIREDVLAKYAVTGICQGSSDDSNVVVIPNYVNIKWRVVKIFEI